MIVICDQRWDVIQKIEKPEESNNDLTNEQGATLLMNTCMYVVSIND